MEKSCNCPSCKSACMNKPGWFMPGQAELLAEHFGVSFETVFRTRLSVDWWEAGADFDKDVFVLSPAVVGGYPGEEFAANPNGKCFFYIDGKCSIEEVKPFECRELMHYDSPETVAERHLGVAHAWNTEEHQEQIADLLGRAPISEPYEPWHLGAYFS